MMIKMKKKAPSPRSPRRSKRGPKEATPDKLEGEKLDSYAANLRTLKRFSDMLDGEAALLSNINRAGRWPAPNVATRRQKKPN
jgi:hypothetical protein